MNKPHKHAELIKAWADGAKVQFKSNLSGVWVDSDEPLWSESYEYRIKPEPAPKAEWHFVDGVKPNWADGQMVYYMNTYYGPTVLGPVNVGSLCFSTMMGSGYTNKVTFIKIVNENTIQS